MSRFFSTKFKKLDPYVPGEQPKKERYLKLNTNESPFEPSVVARKYVNQAAANLNLYSDPECTELVEKIAEIYKVKKEEVICVNGSDELIEFAVNAYCDKMNPLYRPDISYGFYPVSAAYNRVRSVEIPVKEDLTIDINDYIGLNQTIVIANPNAPTGIALSVKEIEKILEGNPNNVVMIDEAYVDFGAESVVPLIDFYDNLLVMQTFSKSRSMAGARLGFGIANKNIISDLNTLRYSTNPYNINSMTMAAGIGALEDEDYTRANCNIIIENREYTVRELTRLGFEMTDSKANFVFAKHPLFKGDELYKKLKEKNVLVRHFDIPKIEDYNRITIGSLMQMKILVNTIEMLMEEKR